MANEAWFDASVKNHIEQTLISGILKEDGEIVVQYVREIKHRKSTKNAEYMALIAILEIISERGISGVTIYGDSKDIINPINGIVYHKHRRERYKTAKNLLTETNSTLKWVRRGNNKEADNLSRRGE